MATAAVRHNTADLTLLMVGKTGHGKSSTANTILGREAFEVGYSAASYTFFPQDAYARRFSKTIKIVDGPGLFDTRLTKGEAVERFLGDINDCMMRAPEGFKALLLVLKYGSRFTEEEVEVVRYLKSIFGKNVVRDFCILVFTHGELFEMRKKKTPDITFLSWIREQMGAMKDLLVECSYRAVLFSNVEAPNPEAQVLELLSLVDTMNPRNIRYQRENFDQSAEDRERLNICANAPKLRETFQTRVNALEENFEKLKIVTKLDQEVEDAITNLQNDARDLVSEMKAQDKKSGVLDHMLYVASTIQERAVDLQKILKLKDSEIKLKGKQREGELRRENGDGNSDEETYVKVIVD